MDIDDEEDDGESKEATDSKVLLVTAAQQAELAHLRAEQKVPILGTNVFVYVDHQLRPLLCLTRGRRWKKNWQPHGCG